MGLGLVRSAATCCNSCQLKGRQVYAGLLKVPNMSFERFFQLTWPMDRVKREDFCDIKRKYDLDWTT